MRPATRRRRQFRWTLAVVCALMWIGARSASAQANFREAIDVPALLKSLDSSVDTVRANAFYSLLWQPQKGPYNAAARTAALLRDNPKRTATIARTLRRALAREERRLKTPGARALTGLYATYYQDLKRSVAALPAAALR